MSLTLSHLHAGYGDVTVLRGISLEVAPGEIVALVGANGAGKTSTLNAISGLLIDLREGEVTLDGKEITSTQPHDRVELGIAHVPQGRQLFPYLTVRENLELGAYASRGRKSEHASLERVLNLFPILRERTAQYAGSLSGGEQQMCAIARGLMSGPRYLLLDEPSLGLAPIIVQNVFEVIGEIVEQGIGVLLVEQNVMAALQLAKRAYVLERGDVVLEGSSENLLRDDRLREAYLGL